MAFRNMKKANYGVFSELDKYCAEQGDPIQNAGAVRWIESEEGEDRRRLKEATLFSTLSFGRTLKIARFDHNLTSLFCTIGFDLPDYVAGFTDEPLRGGMLTAILSELALPPIASTAKIRNVVEVADMASTEKYTGHDSEHIAGLFPAIRCFSISDIRAESTNNLFFSLCLASVTQHKQWMDKKLLGTLETVAELSPVAIPYRTLCRSIFDTDPSAVFLALYRCLEALYAYSHTKKLMHELNIAETQWTNVAKKLESALGWRPREEVSLERLLSLAVHVDLHSILNAISIPLPSEANLISFTTKQIYLLRNSLVHYRALHHTVDHDSIDWNRLCESTAQIVFDVYDSVSGQQASLDIPSFGS